jgi:hypothetical protein
MEGWKRINGERVPLRDPTAKKVAIFKITNLLFKVYFQLKKWELCKNIITVIERPGSDSYIENLDMFPTVDAADCFACAFVRTNPPARLVVVARLMW